MSPSSEPVDLAILGAGSGGYAAALRAADARVIDKAHRPAAPGGTK